MTQIKTSDVAAVIETIKDSDNALTLLLAAAMWFSADRTPEEWMRMCGEAYAVSMNYMYQNVVVN